MEALGSRTESPSQACLEEVESSDIFVGVYAHRYGYVPSCQQSSITEDEFNHAYKLRRPTFCFLVDPEYPWPEHLIESEPGLSHLVAFKHRLSTLVVRDTFTTPAVLATRVVSALGRYPNDFASVVLGTTDGGQSWTMVTSQAPAEPPGGVAPIPGGIIGCPTRPLTPGLATNENGARS